MTVSRFAAALALALLAGTARAEPDVSAVGRVNNSVGGHCTGALVAPRVAVTAAHCLYNRRTGRWLRPEAIHFVVGYDRGDFTFHAVASEYRTGEGYDATRPLETLASDWAVLVLAEAAPETIMPMRVDGTAPDSAWRLRPAGFAKARPHVLTVAPACNGQAAPPFIVSACTVPEGFSGGPLMDAASGHLTGISVATSTTRSLAIPAATFEAAIAAAASVRP